MRSEPASFDINELAAAAGVTTRTIRYYVQQGLLPSSETRGPGARYDRAHLDRLVLIKRLQAQHLPLAEIRKRLEGLTAQQLRDSLEAVPESRKSSASEYVRQLLAGSQPLLASKKRVASPAPPEEQHAAPAFGVAHPAPPVVQEPPPTASVEAPRHPPLARVARSAPEPLDPAPSVGRSTWERHAFTPDVELHLRRPLSREHNRLVERLLEFARHLFSEEV